LTVQQQQGLKLQEQAERDELARDRLVSRVESSIAKIAVNRAAKLQDFTIALEQGAQQLGCDATCVNQCAALYLTLDDKSNCLDQCLCYADPHERALLAQVLGR